MESFKQYLFEEHYPNLADSLRLVGSKSWITPEGKVHSLHPDHSYMNIHHMHLVVDKPKLFKTTSERLREIDPHRYDDLISTDHLGYRKSWWSDKISTDLGKRGYMRVANNTRQLSPLHMEHSYKITNHGYEGTDDLKKFIPALAKIRDTIIRTRVTEEDPISVDVSGNNFGFNFDRINPGFHLNLRSIAHIDEFIKTQDPTQREKSVTQLPVVPQTFTSTQTRQILGRTPPEGSNIPQAIWNNIRTIGDSYIPSFKQYIFESDQKKELFHSFFVSRAGKIIEPTSNPLHANKEVIDHAYIPATQAHDFNMRDAEMHDLLELSDEEVLNFYKHGKGPLNASADRRLSTRGFIKGSHYDKKRNINLQATTSDARDAYHIDDMSEIITSLRSRLSEHPDWVINIDGLKTHEPEELESMKRRLSPAHIKQLTQPGKQFTLVNTDEIDRFITGRGSLSRDPGSGVHSVPSPTEMKRKAGGTDEPESIQKGRFFQSDSFDYSLGANMKTFKQHLHEVKFGPEFGPELANRDVGREFSPGGKFSYTSERAPHETTDPFNPHEHSELLMNFLHDNRMDDRLIAKGERLDRVSPRAQHYMGVIQDAKHHLTQFSNFTNRKGEKVIDPGVWKETAPYDEKDGSHHSHDLYALRLIAELGSSRYAKLGSPIDLRHHMRVMQDPEASDHQVQRARDGIENNQRELAMKTRIAKLLMSSKRARLIFASEIKQHYDRKGREELISKQDI